MAAYVMDRQPGHLGYLLLNEDGAVLSSSGDLENDERTADAIMGLVGLVARVDPAAFPANPEEGFRRLSVTYDDHCYVVCLSNKKVHVVKRALSNVGDGPLLTAEA